ncbi:hypothetical protein DL769_003866 [Monosporascus sp. CRB-8-3]|nr:hypothetical protein DL769_003866 [Monosporascus sp. CRB-8-3]
MPTPQLPAGKKPTATRARHQRPAKIAICSLQSPEQFDCAVKTFTRLAAVPELASRVPRLHIQNRNELVIQLKQPNYGLWKIIDKLLAKLSSLSPNLQQQQRQRDDTDLDIDPDAVAHILETNPPPGNIGNLVIRLTKRYTPALSRFTIWYAKRHLHNLPSRTCPPTSSRRDMTMRYCDIVGHLLRLVTEVEQHSRQDVRLLVDRAVLRVLYAVLLLQLHANVITSYRSEGLLQLDCPDDSAEAYTSIENFESVAQARHEASEAVRDLRAAGGELDSSTCRFLRGNVHVHF